MICKSPIRSHMQLATTEVAAEEADGIEIGGVELQGPGAGRFTIGEDADSDNDSQTGHDVHGEEGKIDDGAGQRSNGAVYSLAHFEPQRHTDLT